MACGAFGPAYERPRTAAPAKYASILADKFGCECCIMRTDRDGASCAMSLSWEERRMSKSTSVVTWRDDPAHFRPSRREILQVGAIGALGLTLGDFFRLKKAMADDDAAGAAKESTAKSVIHIFMPG